MECLFLISFSSSILLACYDGTCYLDETLHCSMYMDGTMCMDGTCLCMNNVYGWNWCDMWYETYVLDMWYIFVVIYICCENCWIKKTKKRDNMQALCRLPPTAKGSLPSAADGKEATWQATVLPGRLTNLVSLPIVADGKGFTVRSGRQRPAVNHLME